MLSESPPIATLPAQDLDRARAFYKDKLGLEPREIPGALIYRCGGSEFALFESTGASRGEFTQIRFEVADIDAAVSDLKGRGVVFETYDYPKLQTDPDGIAVMETARQAWFKDSEGNLLAIGQSSSPG